MYDFLKNLAEPTPRWLEEYSEANGFPNEAFFGSRIVFYPGSGSDGHAVKVFGSTRSAHCFVYADYGMSLDRLKAEIAHPNHGFLGYHVLASHIMRLADVFPDGLHSTGHPRADSFAKEEPFCLFAVFERNEELHDNHGASRFALLFIAADAIAVYRSMFCQGVDAKPPFAILLQDHGFGGNYDRFGGGGLMEEFASRYSVFPDFLLIADNTEPWADYARVPGTRGEHGGMHSHLRYLYRRLD